MDASEQSSRRESDFAFAPSAADSGQVEREPIAIIGIGCRFPGGANDPDSFWRLLCEGVDAITEIPADRWNVRSFYDPKPGTPGKTYARWGGFIEGIDQFDAGFFGISPREAAQMDPQQRLLLEVAYEAVEDAGHVLDRLAGSNTGVFIGISTNDYANIQSTTDDKTSIDTYSFTGVAMSIAANRISYCFNLKGPSIALDTACSSSLVAVHLACRSIWSQESSLALAGGVNVIICPEYFIGFSRLSMLSPQGRCKAFDASGDGFVRAEGVGVIFLKPLSRALADGDPIYAVIRGTAVNQDGRTSGITVPSQEAQEAMLREAYQQAGVAPEQMQYVEAHGTGTLVGDPIEADALGAVLSAHRPEGDYSVIGSVKTNIGHLEAGAGIAGLIKVALMLKHGLIPPNLHFKNPNPVIDFEKLKLRVPQRLEPWPENDGPKYAGVNSFGFGGTNAHVVLGEAPSRENQRQPSPAEASNVARLIPLSARSPEALKSLAGAYADFLKGPAKGSELSLEDIGYNLSLRRTHHDHRLSLVVHTKEELIEHLEGFLAGEARPGMHSGHVVARQAPKLAFVFSGQGPQWWAMGRELLEQEPVFRNMIEQCDALLGSYADWSLMEELTADEERSRLQGTSIAQPAIFALQVALAALWRSWGVEPEAVVGHSVGEAAAAHIAGVLDLEGALKVIFHRGRCMDLASSKGRMLAAGLTVEEAERLIAGYEDRVSLAAINSPSSVTLSGDAEVLSEMSHILEQRGVFCSFLRVNYAFHSPQMDLVRDELLESLQGLKPNKATKLIFSTVTGQMAEGPEFDAAYWWQNVRKPVRFAQAVDGLIDQGHTVFLELSPHPVLANSVTECLQEKQQQGLVLPSLRRKEEERLQMLGSLGALYTSGYPPDWKRFYPDGGRHVQLPRYPWQHESFWHESEEVKQARLRVCVHPLLGRQLRSASPSWSVEVSRSAFPYLQDHKVQGHVVFPAAGYLEMVLAAAKEIFGAGTYIVEEVDLHRALFLPDGGEAPALQTTFYPDDLSFDIHSRLKKSDQQWTLHAHGKIHWEPSARGGKPVNLEGLRANCLEEISKGVCYERLRERRGLQYGASFQGIERIWRRDGEAIGVIDVPEHLQAEVGDYLIHPAVFDACLQVLFETLASESLASRFEVFLPVHVDQVRFFNRPGPRVWSHARLAKEGGKTLEGSIRLFDQEGNALVEIRGLKCQSVDTVQGAVSEAMDNWIYEFQWQLKARSEAKSNQRHVDFLPPVEEMRARLQAESGRWSEEVGGKIRYQAIETDLNQLCSIYIIKAFRELGWDVAQQQRLTVDSLAQQLGVVSQHHRLLERFLGILAKDGWLKKVGSEWEVCNTPPTVDTDERWKSVLQRYPAFYAELMLTRGCGERLAEVLQGKVDPLQLIFPESSVITMEHLYQDSPTAKIYNLLVASAISIALERLPEGRSVRLLEIGGGTGGLTSYVLPTLPADRMEYIFTDISPFFLQKAEQKFRDYPFLKHQLLDIEKDPAEQGFEPHSFDFILAGNVLHATCDLRQTLSHVQKLLASEGLFVLLETESPGRWVDLVFGLTEGWWRFSDADLRPSCPLLSREKWVQLLEEVGFTNPIPVSEMGGRYGQNQLVVVARGPALQEEAEVAPSKASAPGKGEKHWLIFADKGGVGEQLAEFLRSRGDRTLLIFAGEEYQHIDDEQFRVCPDRPEDFQQLLNDVLIPNQSIAHDVVHCWSLDSPPAEETTLSSLQRSEVLGCHSVMHLIQAWANVQGVASPTLSLITRGAQPVGEKIKSVSVAQSPLCGLGRVIMNEHQDFGCSLVDLSEHVSPTEIQSLCEELINGDGEDEIALRGQARYVPRLVRSSLKKSSTHEKKVVNVNTEPVRLEISAPGVFENLTLRQTKRGEPSCGQVEIQVVAAALNFRDVMKALGLYPTDGDDHMLLGDECAGRIVAVGEGVDGLKVGDEVIAVAPGSFGSFVTTSVAVTVRKPSHLSFEEGVTIPVAFLTAYYALHHLGRISPGERVLIHAATGGVGLAAVQIAQQVGAEVFATAGSPEKRDFLKALGVQHVMDSRSLSFADEITEITDGQGVDIVLNSLAGEAIHKGLSCLAPYGRFLEIGKRDIYQNSRLGLRTFKNNLSFFAIDLGRVMAERPALIRKLLGEIMQLFEKRELHPLPHRVFSIGEVAHAFQHMAQAKHIGKIVVSVRDHEVPVEPLVDEAISFRSNATYLITGGLGGFGLAVAEWMVENGARHLVLMGRSGAGSEEARRAISVMESKGAQVVVAKADVSREEDVARVLNEIEQLLPPLRGIVHAAMVVDDGILVRLDRERFKKVMEPKVQGAWNLHRLGLNMPLDFFVLFSSITAMAGSPGQGNYVAANAFLDALAHHRRIQNLPALSINWGHLADTGYLARHREIGEHLDSLGIKGFTSKQAMEILGRLLLRKAVQVGVVNADWRQWAKYGSVPPRFSLLVSPEALDQQRGEGSGRLRDRVLASQPDQRRQIIESYLKDQVARVLGTSASRLESERPLSEMGLDSLMMVELRNKIERELGVSLPAVELMRGPSISTLSQVLLDQLTRSDVTSPKPLEPDIQRSRSGEIESQAAEELLQKIDQLSEHEVETLLDKLVDG